MTAGSRVMRTWFRESQYSNRPARAYTLRVVSISSTCPSSSASLGTRWYQRLSDHVSWVWVSTCTCRRKK